MKLETNEPDERKRDVFEITGGNLEVLKTIPEMMQDPKWRKEIRRLVLDYKSEKIL